MSSRAGRSIFAVWLAIAMAACSNGGAVTPQAPAPATATNGAHRAGKLVLRIHIPQKARKHRVRIVRDGKPAYVSAATQGMTLAISGPTNLNETVGLTSASPGCSGAVDGTFCTLTLAGFLPCSGTSSCYTATIATYDAVSCTPACSIPHGANELSAAQDVTFRVVTGQANALNVTLGGYPAGFTVAPLKAGFLQGDVHRLNVWGPSVLQLVVEAQDADGNAIVGPGAPAITASSGGSTLAVSNPLASAPNLVAMRARTSGSPAAVTPGFVQLQLTATPAAGSGARPLSQNVSVKIAHSIVCAGLQGSVVEFFDGNTGTPNVTISGSNTNFGSTAIYGLAFDGNGTLYASIVSADLVEAFAADARGNAAPDAAIAGGATQLSSPFGLAVDDAGRLYVANGVSKALTEYGAGSGGDVAPTAVISGAATSLEGPFGLAFDAAATAYVADYNNNSVTEYPAGGSGDEMPTQAISGASTGLDGPSGLATDLTGRLYVASQDDGKILEFAAGVSGNVSPIATIAGAATGLDFPVAVAVDANGAIYVGDNELLAFAPGSAGNVAPVATISTGLVTSVAVVPASFTP